MVWQARLAQRLSSNARTRFRAHGWHTCTTTAYIFFILFVFPLVFSVKPKAAPRPANVTAAHLPLSARFGRAGLLSSSKDAGCVPNDWPQSEFVSRCEYAAGHPSCTEISEEGHFNYLRFRFCDGERFPGLVLPILGLWLVAIFLALGLTAEEFFSPTMGDLASTLGLSDPVAGVTFLAFGNGAPDLFSAFAALTSSEQGIELGMGALFGAGMFVTTVIFGSIAYVAKNQRIKRLPFLRDCCFLLVTIVWVFFHFSDGKIYGWEAVMLVMFYFVYVTVVLVGRFVFKEVRRQKARERLLRGGIYDVIASSPSLQHGHGTPVALSIARQTGREGPLGEATNLPAVWEDDAPGPRVEVIGAEPAREGHLPALEDEMNTMIEDRVRVPSPDAQPSEGPAEPSAKRNLDTSPRKDPSAYIPIADSSEREEDEIDSLLQWLPSPDEINAEVQADITQSRLGVLLHWISRPLVALLWITVPRFGDNDAHWRPKLAAIWVLVPPLFMLLAFGLLPSRIGTVPITPFVVVVFLGPSVVAFRRSRASSAPFWRAFFLLMAFGASVSWIYVIANELVALLTSLGVILDIDSQFMGLAVLAWGNSIGDWAANLTVARQGFPIMALSASIGAPLLNILFGVGVAMAYNAYTFGEPFALRRPPNLTVSALFFMVAILLHLVLMPLNGFRLSRSYAIYCFVLYFVFLITNAVVTFGDSSWVP